MILLELPLPVLCSKCDVLILLTNQYFLLIYQDVMLNMSQGNPMSSFSHTWEIARSDLNNVCWLDVCKKRWSCSNSWMSTSSMLSLPLHCIGEKKLPQFSKSLQSQLNLMIENTFNLERRGKKSFPRWQHWCHLQRSSWQKPKNNWRDIHSTTVVDTLWIQT